MEVEVIYDGFLDQWTIAVLQKDGSMADITKYAPTIKQAIEVAKVQKRRNGAEQIRIINREGETEVL